MPSTTIHDPLAIAQQVCKLHNELVQLGLVFHYGTNPSELRHCKKLARDSEVTPYFDDAICSLPPDRFFWTQLQDSEQNTISLQAFRLDQIAESLADWAPTFTIGLYMRRGEVLVPAGRMPARGSIAERISGRVVYHGELWVSSKWRPRNIFNSFTRLGVLLATIKWNPDAIWAVASKQMATHGHPTRMGYSHVEGGFMRWQWPTDDIPAEEWLLVSDRMSLNQIVSAVE